MAQLDGAAATDTLKGVRQFVFVSVDALVYEACPRSACCDANFLILSHLSLHYALVTE